MALRNFVILRTAVGASRKTQWRYPVLTALCWLSVMNQTALAQQPMPLFNTLPGNPPAATAPGPASSIPAQALPPPDATASPSASQPPATANAPPTPATARDFCGQSVTAQPANPTAVPEVYRPYVGIFSDADWNPTTCAALVVENIASDGTATITYVFGPLVAGGKAVGGVLHGTGIVKDGALLFQNNDGSQYAFQPFYSDLAGKWTAPKGQTYQAIFKRSY
jgi:hypothetical protein